MYTNIIAALVSNGSFLLVFDEKTGKKRFDNDPGEPYDPNLPSIVTIEHLLFHSFD